MKRVEMSRALTAAMSLRLPGTAGKLANKMRYVDSKGPLFHDGGLIRNITQGKHEKVYAVGISSKSKSMPALGGLLYGAAALRHDLVVANNEVSEGQQDSRVDINDMNFLGASERLVWKEFILVYRLLSDLMSSDTKPDIIFVDIPLLVSRAEQSVFLEEEDVQEIDDVQPDNTYHKKLIEETQQLRVQMDEYEEELTDLSDGVEKTNKLLNFVLCFLILVLLVVIGFIGYSIWKAGGFNL